MNLNEIINNKIINNNNLQSILETYYSVDNYNFINDELIKEHIIDKFNKLDTELFILDKDFILNNTSQILSSSSGILLFDLSMTNDNQLYTNIHLLSKNYKNINLHLIEDNYILEYDTKENIDSIDKDILQTNLKTIFSNDLQKLLLKQRINNIPYIIKNDRFSEKILEDLSFSNQYSYQNIFSNDSIANYKNNLKLNLNSDNYKVVYVFNDDIQTIDKTLYDKILEKLKEFNTYIDDIVIQTNKCYSDSNIQLDNITSDKQIDLKKLFEQNELNNFYIENKSNLKIEMSDVLNQTFSIVNIDDKIITIDKFYDNIVKFLNELVKRKINKIIKINNLITIK